MDFYQLTNSTIKSIKYKTTNGTYKTETEIDNPTWIGGALLNTAFTKNKFVMVDSGKGGDGGTLPTSVGDYKIMYFDH